jgi:hypothetical protein
MSLPNFMQPDEPLIPGDRFQRGAYLQATVVVPPVLQLPGEFRCRLKLQFRLFLPRTRFGLLEKTPDGKNTGVP